MTAKQKTFDFISFHLFLPQPFSLPYKLFNESITEPMCVDDICEITEFKSTLDIIDINFAKSDSRRTSKNLYLCYNNKYIRFGIMQTQSPF